MDVVLHMRDRFSTSDVVIGTLVWLAAGMFSGRIVIGEPLGALVLWVVPVGFVSMVADNFRK